MSLTALLLRRVCAHPLPGWRICGAPAGEGDPPRCAGHSNEGEKQEADSQRNPLRVDRAGPGPVQELPAGLNAGELRSQPTEPQLKADSSPLATERAGSTPASPGRKGRTGKGAPATAKRPGAGRPGKSRTT